MRFPLPSSLPAAILVVASLVALSALPAAVGSAHPASTEAEKALCPVCRVHEGETEAEEIAATLEHDGQVVGFCSEDCRDRFTEAPTAYLPPVFPRPAPAFTVVDLDGKEVSSEAVLRDRIVLLDFWATWCAPCVDDLPKLTRLHQEYSDRGVAVVGISIDEGDGAAKTVSRMLRRRDATHPVYLDGTGTPAWAAYLVRTVPAQFLVDAEGRIVAQWSGKTDLAAVEAEIRGLLGRSEP